MINFKDLNDRIIITEYHPPSRNPDDEPDVNKRLAMRCERDATHDPKAQYDARELLWRDHVWRPYVRAGAPYGEDMEGANRWAKEQQASTAQADIEMPWFKEPDPDAGWGGIRSVGLQAIKQGGTSARNLDTAGRAIHDLFLEIRGETVSFDVIDEATNITPEQLAATRERLRKSMK